MTASRRLNKKKTVLLVLLLLIISVTGVYCALESEYVQKKFFYPLLYTKEINKFANENNLKPWFVASIIRNESGFKADVTSSSGAIGLMQVMPETGSWIAQKKEIDNFQESLLREPEVNIAFGCWYLNDLWQEFNDEKIVIAAYNAGRGQVKSWLDEKKWNGKDVEAIPFKETREYVKNVLHDKERYKNLYQDAWNNKNLDV